ncbi:MAG: recombinase family protein [Clostridium sp.]|nr:recombinase family protein [Clostridium sp.]
MEKLRAVIYNRCSTEEESQKDALIKQVQESKNCVAEQGWQLVDSYVEAKSGTTIKGRNEYNRLYQDLEQDKFDIIVIKSQDRLMRNTKDWYLFLDRMQKNRKRLYMYLEHKFYTPDDALITGIKAILAEEYSRELSKKINNAHRNRQKEGERFVFTNQTYGLKKLPDKSIVIDEKEAEMVRMIFNLSANGYGTHCSAEILYQNGYRNRNGKMLTPSSIRNIIRNPIYKGTIVQNRQHYDFESKQILKNPQSEWIVHEDAVPAIIEEELFIKANQGLEARKQEGNRGGAYIKGSNPGKYDFSGRIFCGLCNSPFYRTVRQNKERQVTEWKCSNYLHNGRKNPRLRKDGIRKVEREENKGCDNIHLDEKRLYAELEHFCREKSQGMQQQKDELLKETLSILRKALSANNIMKKREYLQSSLDKLIRQKEILLEKLLEEIISDEDFKIKNKEFQDKIDDINAQLMQLEEDVSQNMKLESRINTIREKLESGMIEQAQTAEMIVNIKEIRVFPSYMEICFDSWAVMGISNEYVSPPLKDAADKLSVVRIPQTCASSHRPVMEEEKSVILELMRKDPEITAKKIAEKMGVNLSLVHRRIRELKAEDKIKYSKSNGRGKWIAAREARR